METEQTLPYQSFIMLAPKGKLVFENEGSSMSYSYDYCLPTYLNNLNFESELSKLKIELFKIKDSDRTKYTLLIINDLAQTYNHINENIDLDASCQTALLFIQTAIQDIVKLLMDLSIKIPEIYLEKFKGLYSGLDQIPYLLEIIKEKPFDPVISNDNSLLTEKVDLFIPKYIDETYRADLIMFFAEGKTQKNIPINTSVKDSDFVKLIIEKSITVPLDNYKSQRQLILKSFSYNGKPVSGNTYNNVKNSPNW
jgi:hypothetical protein